MNDTPPHLESFKEILSSVFKSVQIQEQDDEIKITISNYEGTKEFLIQRGYLDEIYSLLNLKQKEEETILYGDNSYETLVSFTNRPFFSSDDSIKINDPDSKLTYEISVPSDEYLIYILQLIIEKEHVSRFMRFTSWRQRKFFERYSEIDDLFLLMKKLIPRLYTLKITSDSNQKLTHFVNLANSFLFNITYNLDIAIIETRFIDEFIRSDRLSRIRKAEPEEIEPPKRKYIANLVNRYQMAVSTDSPQLQFMSFYNISEHFFEEIYNQDLIDTIKHKITDPGFSYKRKNDLKDLIKVVEGRLKKRGDDFSYNERDALLLTLKNYVNIENIKSKIKTYDSTLIDYYKNNNVVFSNGSAIDLDSTSFDDILNKLTSRIYATRNSIVHNKEGNKPKYIPFKHDKELMQEIPLIRFIAEDIIINSSELIVA